MKARPVPSLLVNIVQTALQVCDGVRFYPVGTCSACGGALSKYDERRKRFALLIEDDMPRPVHVILQRSSCRSCGRISVPEDPFYPGTRIGSPVVDLCRSLSVYLPCTRVSSLIGRMGVRVDRWTVRNYAQLPLPDNPAVDLFGMKIPLSVITLSTLASSVDGPANPGMDEVLAACRYPSRPQGARTPPPGGDGAGGS